MSNMTAENRKDSEESLGDRKSSARTHENNTETNRDYNLYSIERPPIIGNVSDEIMLRRYYDYRWHNVIPEIKKCLCCKRFKKLKEKQVIQSKLYELG